MSYDILFVPRRPGQSWDDALDEAEGRDVLGDALRPERLAQWDRVVASLRPRLGDLETTVDDDVCEATSASGLQVSLYPDEASLSFPYADRPDRQAFHDLVVDTVGVIERETGLRAWDAQTAEPFDGRVHDETGLAATRRIGQEAADVSATEAMAERAAAGAIGPDTGPVDVSALPVGGAAPAGSADGDGRTDDRAHDRVPATADELDRERRRAVRYVAVGVVVVVAALLLRTQGEPSTLAGLALAIGVADVVIGVLLYRGWSRRAAGARR